MENSKSDIGLISNKKILETGTSNLLFIKNKKVFTPIKDYYEGNTLRFFKSKIKKIITKDIFVKDLKSYDEIYYSWVIKRKIPFQTFIQNIKLVIQSLEFISKNPKENIYVMEYQDVINKKEKYNNHLMNIITTYNKVIPREKLFEEKYNHKIKNTVIYKPDKKSITINVNTENHKFKETYNQLLNSLKIKL